MQNKKEKQKANQHNPKNTKQNKSNKREKMEKKRKGKTKAKGRENKKNKTKQIQSILKIMEKHYIYSTCNHHLVYTRYLHEQKSTNDKNQELFFYFFSGLKIIGIIGTSY